MHQTVLVVGVKNIEELEEKLYPFYELGCTMDNEQIKNDSRSVFISEHSKEEAEEIYKKEIKRYPTKKQISYFQKNFTEVSNIKFCKQYYADKNDSRGKKYAPESYVGNDFAYKNVKIGNEFKFLFVSEENKIKAQEWIGEKEIEFYNLLSNYSREDFLEDYPDFNSYITNDNYSFLEWNEGKQTYGYWDNPNGFWDWYEVGGRWFAFFKMKETANKENCKYGKPAWNLVIEKDDMEYLEDRADALKIGDIDFQKMEEENIKSAEKEWNSMYNLFYKEDLSVELTNEERDKRFREIMKMKENETKEEFIERHRKRINIFAIIYNGEWLEHNYKNNEKEEYICKNEGENKDIIRIENGWDFITNLDPETDVMLVDCHS